MVFRHEVLVMKLARGNAVYSGHFSLLSAITMPQKNEKKTNFF